MTIRRNPIEKMYQIDVLHRLDTKKRDTLFVSGHTFHSNILIKLTSRWFNSLHPLQIIDG